MVQADSPTKVSARKVKQSLAIYSDPDAAFFKNQGLFMTVLHFLLRSACLSLEIFLHFNFGKRYLTIPKLMAAIILPTICLFLSQFDFDFKVGFSLTQPGFLAVVRPNAEKLADAVSNEVTSLQAEWNSKAKEQIRLLKEKSIAIAKEAEEKISAAEEKMNASPLAERFEHTETVTTLREAYARRIASLHSAADNAEVSLALDRMEAAQLENEPPPPSILERTRNFFRMLINPSSRKALLIGLSMFFVVFSIFANLQLILIYITRIFEGQFGLREAHPHSSGEPIIIFNPLYLLAHRFNAKTDLVKQFAEPAFCYILGMYLRQNDILPPHFEFISAWLMLGAALIFGRVYMENRNREKLHLDRLANERNAEAFHLQQSMREVNENSPETLQARGK